MSNTSVREFFQKLEQDMALGEEYKQLMSDNISLIVIVEFARQLGFTFSTREFAEYLIRTSTVKADEEPKVNILSFSKKAG